MKENPRRQNQDECFSRTLTSSLALCPAQIGVCQSTYDRFNRQRFGLCYPAFPSLDAAIPASFLQALCKQPPRPNHRPTQPWGCRTPKPEEQPIDDPYPNRSPRSLRKDRPTNYTNERSARTATEVRTIRPRAKARSDEPRDIIFCMPKWQCSKNINTAVDGNSQGNHSI